MANHYFTKEEKDFIASIVHGRSYSEITAMVNEHFHLRLGINQIGAFIGNHKLNTGRDGRFTPGHIPANKGKKGVGGWEPTQFKKGQIPLNYRPVGSERVNVNGYIEIKVSDPKKWRLKHVIIWEEANGPVPKGYAVIFGDGNKSNLDLDNLVLVSRGELAVLNRTGLIQKDAELTRSAVLVARLLMKSSERKKKKAKQR